MASLNGFNAAEVEPRSAFEPLPAGEYEAIIEESEEKPTKDGRGSYLQLVVQVVAGDHKGRKLWARLNLNNPSQQAVEIARAELSAICRAVGVMNPQDSGELHNKPLVVAVKVREYQGEYQNEIKGWKSVRPNTAAIGGAAPKPAAAKPAAPWKR
jgi:hypothetical protein